MPDEFPLKLSTPSARRNTLGVETVFKHVKTGQGTVVLTLIFDLGLKGEKGLVERAEQQKRDETERQKEESRGICGICSSPSTY